MVTHAICSPFANHRPRSMVSIALVSGPAAESQPLAAPRQLIPRAAAKLKRAAKMSSRAEAVRCMLRTRTRVLKTAIIYHQNVSHRSTSGDRVKKRKNDRRLSLPTCASPGSADHVGHDRCCDGGNEHRDSRMYNQNLDDHKRTPSLIASSYYQFLQSLAVQRDYHGS